MSKCLGFTGTRFAPSNQQLSWLADQVEHAGELHHGGCVGADAMAHVFGLLYGVPITVHPPVDMKLVDARAVTPRSDLVKVLPALPYHERNRAIVDETEEIIALPNGPELAHSGTWYTVRYATGRVDQRLSKHIVPVTICYPDGRIEIRMSNEDAAR